MEKYLCLLLTLFTAIHTAYAQQRQDYLNELLSDIESEFWITGNYPYIFNAWESQITDPDIMSHYEDSEKAAIYLYTGLSGLYLGYTGADIKDYFEKAVVLATDTYGENSRTEGLATMGLAQLIGNSDNSAAVPYDRKAVSILETTCGKNSLESAVSEQNLALHLALAGDMEEARETFASADCRFVNAGKEMSLMYARFLVDRAVYWTILKDGEKAIADLQKSINLIKEISDRKEKGLADFDTAATLIYYTGMTVYIYNKFGLYNEAIDVAEYCIDIMDDYGITKTSNYASCLANIGTTYIFLKDFRTAEQWYQKSKVLFETIGDTTSTGYRNVSEISVWLKTQK